MNPSTPRPNTLLVLPFEIREQIFVHVMADSPTTVLIPHDRVVPTLQYLPRHTLPMVAFTSHQYFLEVTLSYLRQTTLRVPGPKYPADSGLYNFLSSLGANSEGFRNVRRLEYRDMYNGFAVPDEQRKYEKKGRRLGQMANMTVLRCSGLKELTIIINSLKLQDFSILMREDLTYPLNASMLLSPKKFDENMRLSRVFEYSGHLVLKVVFKEAVALAEIYGFEVRELVGNYVEFLEACRAKCRSKFRILVEHV